MFIQKENRYVVTDAIMQNTVCVIVDLSGAGNTVCESNQKVEVG